MSNNASALDSLLGLTIEVLMARLKSGECTAAELNVARQLLKDNGIGVVPVREDELKGLRDRLPVQSVDEMAEGDYLN